MKLSSRQFSLGQTSLILSTKTILKSFCIVAPDSTEMEGTSSASTANTSSASTSVVAAPTQPASKVAIPRLARNRSPRPSSGILLLPNHSQSPSPTISKPKFVAIQPKPHFASDNGLSAPSLPQLKEEETSRRAGTKPLEGSWVEALTHSHDDEIAHYWSQPGEAITDSLSPKVQNNELSQLRVLLEQNEAKTKISNNNSWIVGASQCSI